jgi:hypothetical protein
VSEEGIAARLQEFLERQRVCYEVVRDLGREQSAAIEAGDTSALLKILARKQEAMQQVAAASAEGDDLLAAWEREKDGVPADERARVEETHRQVKEILGEVLELEEQGRSALQAKTGERGKKIAGLQKGKQMLKAYGAQPQRRDGGRFTDNTK